MSLLTSSKDGSGRVRHPQLRLLRGARGDLPEGQHDAEQSARPSLRVIPTPSRILVAGSDAAQRAAVLRDLTETLPADTPFEEADGVSEVLEQAPSSGVVMLAGDLDDASVESVMHLLGTRHPKLPVIALGASKLGLVSAAGR
jgi:hypothetical protein